MSLPEHKRALETHPLAYPLLMGALRSLAEGLAAGSEVHPAVEGREGAVWRPDQRSFFWGYWWSLSYGNLFGGVNLMFERREKMKNPGSSDAITWIPTGEESGFAAYVEVRKGTRHDGKIVTMLSIDRFIAHLTEEGIERLKKKLAGASVGVYDQSQLRGDE